MYVFCVILVAITVNCRKDLGSVYFSCSLQRKVHSWGVGMNTFYFRTDENMVGNEGLGGLCTR